MPEAQAMGPIAQIVAAFCDADFDDVPCRVEEGLAAGIEADTLLDDGLVAGIRAVGEQFRRGEVYLPEMMLAAEAWQAGMDLLQPHLARRSSDEARGKIVIGTVKGDIHSLGKNILITLFKTAGFETVDLGVDVPASRFVAEAQRQRADVIAVCALMTTTMPQQREVIEHLVAAGARDDYYVMVGGGCTNGEWAAEIKADAYGETAADAVALAEAYMQQRAGGK